MKSNLKIETSGDIDLSPWTHLFTSQNGEVETFPASPQRGFVCILKQNPLSLSLPLCLSLSFFLTFPPRPSRPPKGRMGRSANNFDINSKFHNLGVLPLYVNTPMYRYRLTFHEELGLREPMFYRSSAQLFYKEALFPDPGRSSLWI